MYYWYTSIAILLYYSYSSVYFKSGTNQRQLTAKIQYND